jgi:hypothetical protein
LKLVSVKLEHLIKHELIKRLHARFDQVGIVIPFPIRTIAQREAARAPQGA